MASDDLGAPIKGDGQGCRRWGRRQAEFPADVSAAVAARALVREVCAAWGRWMSWMKRCWWSVSW